MCELDRAKHGRNALSPDAQLSMDCEESFCTVRDGIDTLRLLWDQLQHGSIDYGPRLGHALHFTLSPMEDAIKELGERLNLIEKRPIA